VRKRYEMLHADELMAKESSLDRGIEGDPDRGTELDKKETRNTLLAGADAGRSNEHDNSISICWERFNSSWN